VFGRWVHDAARIRGSASGAGRAVRSILVHEHVLVDFIGADEIKPGRYDADEVFRVARPKLEAIRKHGCVRMLEATPNFLGRDARLMRRLSQATGVEIGSSRSRANHKFVPPFARTKRPGNAALDRGSAQGRASNRDSSRPA
jgi:hypothetical protein